MRDTEVFQQLLVRACLLQRVELRAMQVLEQGIPQHVVVARIAHDRGDDRKARDRGCPQSTLAHDELVGRLTGLSPRALAHHDGLQNPELTHGVHQLGELVLAELGARLLRVRHDVARRDRCETRARHSRELHTLNRRELRKKHIDGSLAVTRGNKCADAPAESGALLSHQAASPRRAISAAASRYESEPGEPSS